MNNITLLDIESVLIRALDISLLLGSDKKKDRKYAKTTLHKVILPRLSEICGEEEVLFSVQGNTQFYSFVGQYVDLLKQVKYQEASKLSEDYLLNLRRNFIPINHL